ncbi:MAG: phosphoribosylamine--glycine ligase [Candidatus Omnitrophica bacterium]|nr:phosphoribosylamine--glycine ligase [Candidatus Omnitrophota bacterium]
MKILVLGSGGREHTLVYKIGQSSLVDKIFCIPGNAGIAQDGAECVNISLDDQQGLIEFAKREAVDLTVVGPEVPLAEGIVDAFEAAGLKIFGPRKQAAQLESSKIFAKNLLRKYNVPTADFKIFSDLKQALSFLRSKDFPQVIKADGLAAGKGVRIVNSYPEAKVAVEDMMQKKIFQKAGERILVEECLIGDEVSIMVLTDSETILPLVSSQDHKRVFDNDSGPNTGGMGAYSPAAIGGDLFKQIIDSIVVPVISGLKKQGIVYKGVLYVGIMLTSEGPKVLEFNVRFGDPETQVILPRLKTDIVRVFQAVVEARLKDIELDWDERSCVCVVLASGGYPGHYEKNKPISGLGNLAKDKDVFVFHAGTKFYNGELVTSGGRVLGISALGPTLDEAITRMYEAVSQISFKAMHFRKDIAQRALKPSVSVGFDPGIELKRNVK